MTTLGTPSSQTAKKVMLLGSGELGKEVVIALQRLGVETLAVDRYPGAPAMQVAHRSLVIDMLDPKALRALVQQEKPDLIVPELEAIATAELVTLEQEGFQVIPSAKAAQLTMNREGIRRLAAEELGLLTSPYRFAATTAEYKQAVAELGCPCVVKPVMSSSGKGQSLVKTQDQAPAAFEHALIAGRGKAAKVIVEGFVDFDFEITLLTLKTAQGTLFCEPIGHRQEKGDYQESWQPQPMSPAALAQAREIAQKVTQALGGVGIFGVELFVKGDQVYFSEVSPRPHDTGMVTMISQNLNQFELHVRAILGLPVPRLRQYGPAASKALLVAGHSEQVSFSNLEAVLAEPDTDLRLFGKPKVEGERRMGVVLALGETLEAAKAKVMAMARTLKVQL